MHLLQTKMKIMGDFNVKVVQGEVMNCAWQYGLGNRNERSV